MNKKTRLILSLVGICAVIVPAGLLLFITTNKTDQKPNVSTETRSIDQRNVEEAVKNLQKKTVVFPTPSPATPSAKPSGEGTSSAR